MLETCRRNLYRCKDSPGGSGDAGATADGSSGDAGSRPLACPEWGPLEELGAGSGGTASSSGLLGGGSGSGASGSSDAGSSGDAGGSSGDAGGISDDGGGAKSDVAIAGRGPFVCLLYIYTRKT